MGMAHQSPSRTRVPRTYIVTEHAVARVKEYFAGWHQLEGALNADIGTILLDAVENGKKENFYQLAPNNAVEMFWVVDVGYRLRTDYSLYALCVPDVNNGRPVIKTVLTAEMYQKNSTTETVWSRSEDVMKARSAHAVATNAPPVVPRTAASKSTLADVMPKLPSMPVARPTEKLNPPGAPAKKTAPLRAVQQEGPAMFFVIIGDMVHHCDEAALAALMLTAAQSNTQPAVHRVGPPCTASARRAPST